jgi:hypothetical protein
LGGKAVAVGVLDGDHGGVAHGVVQQRGEIVGFMAIRGSYLDRMYVKPSDQR